VPYILYDSMSNQFLLAVCQQWHNFMCNFSLGRAVVPKLGVCPTDGFLCVVPRSKGKFCYWTDHTVVVIKLTFDMRIHGKRWVICDKTNSMLRTSRAPVRTVAGRPRIASLRRDAVLKPAVGKDRDW
jgi:hypothetical protein